MNFNIGDVVRLTTDKYYSYGYHTGYECVVCSLGSNSRVVRICSHMVSSLSAYREGVYVYTEHIELAFKLPIGHIRCRCGTITTKAKCCDCSR